MKYKVVITTSGTGSRLGELTKNRNKALLPLAGKPAIEYLLDRYEKDVPLVFTLGYLGDQIKAYLQKEHPDRDIELVTVDPYEGPGSSLGFSLLQTKKHLQIPFIFHACDTIIREKIPAPDNNWAGSFLPEVGIDLSAYRTHNMKHGQLLGINEKGAVEFAPIHIGLTGIFDFTAFWATLEKQLSLRVPGDTSLSDVHVVDAMIKSGVSFRSVNFPTWLDTGNMEAIQKTELYLNKSR